MNAGFAAAVCGLLFTLTFARAEPPKADEDVKLLLADLGVRQLSIQCLHYSILFDKFPENLEDLLTPPCGKALIESDDLKDPWGNTYQYDAKGKHQKNRARPDVWTVTPAGRTLGNWPEEKKDKK